MLLVSPLRTTRLLPTVTGRRPALRKVLIILTAAFILPVGEGTAQDVMMEGSLPDTVVITASREAEDVRLSGRRVTVLTARDIAALPVTSVDELLRTVGGVEVQSRGGFGVQSDLTIRGSTFNGVLLLLDGARVNDPMTGHFLSDLPLPLSEIARIEVLRGPATVLYGPDAVGGVVQIFTYAGLQAAGAGPQSLGGTAYLESGAFGLYNLGASVRTGLRAGALSAATTWQTSDGMPIRSADGRTLHASFGEVRTDFRRHAHTAALAKDLGQTSLYVRAGADAREFGAFHFYTPFASDTAREKTSTLWAQARLQHSAGTLPWQVQLAAKHHDDEYVYNPVTPANRHASRLLSGQGHVTRALGSRASVVGGASVFVRSIDSNNMGRHGDASAGVFAVAKWRPVDHVALHAGGRLDYDPAYGVEPTPQLGAAYNRGIVSLRVGSGRAVRAPNYIERFFNTTLASPRGRDLGNPDLAVESAWTHEIGLGLYPANGLSMHAGLFSRTVDDLIDFARLTPADTVFLAHNLHRVRTRGIEADVELYRPVGSTGRLRVYTSYTYLDADLGLVPEGVTYKYALTNARHLLQGTGTLYAGAVTLGLQGLWKEPLDGEAYAVFNLSAGYRFDVGRQRLMVTGEVRNLFDRQYTEVFDAPMPGRWWIVGLRLAR